MLHTYACNVHAQWFINSNQLIENVALECAIRIQFESTTRTGMYNKEWENNHHMIWQGGIICIIFNYWCCSKCWLACCACIRWANCACSCIAATNCCCCSGLTLLNKFIPGGPTNSSLLLPRLHAAHEHILLQPGHDHSDCIPLGGFWGGSSL